MKNDSVHTGTLIKSDGSSIDYVLLPLTFSNYKTQGAMLVEFWQEHGKTYLTGIGVNSCLPMHSVYKYTHSIERK